LPIVRRHLTKVEDLSLHILDIAENSINAGARRIEITVREDVVQDMLTITLADDGEGMNADVLQKVTDPFYTTRTTRRVGLGLSLLSEAAKACNGTMNVQSTPEIGTTVTATFQLSHIDRKPLGDIATTIVMLVAGNPEVDLKYHYERDGQVFTFDTQELKEHYPDLDVNAPSTLTFIQEYITEHTKSLS
jgi:anti-sigma regulatory factor (Ser/Thr protein kinase)